MDLGQKHPFEMEEIEAKLFSSLQNPKEGFAKSLGAVRLQEAMAYSLFGKGKRLRPWLVLESARVAKESLLSEEQVKSLAFPAAIAIEYVHTYSLIHDDLPAMDNDDFRRGLPTSHKKFDEATAILAGDALLADAFAVLADAKIQAAQQCAVLAKAIGSCGMIQGQMDDIHGATQTRDESYFLETNRYKTGKLFECACVLGALSVNAKPEMLSSLRCFGMSYGLAFQLMDDLTDESEIVFSLGRQRVLDLAKIEMQTAVRHLLPFGKSADRLLDLVTTLKY